MTASMKEAPSPDIEDALEALELVRAYSQAPEAAPGPWVCPSCQEQLDGVFTQCWRCGYERPNWELFDAEPPPST